MDRTSRGMDRPERNLSQLSERQALFASRRHVSSPKCRSKFSFREDLRGLVGSTISVCLFEIYMIYFYVFACMSFNLKNTKAENCGKFSTVFRDQ